MEATSLSSHSRNGFAASLLITKLSDGSPSRREPSGSFVRPKRPIALFSIVVWYSVVLACILLGPGSAKVYGDVGVVLDESLGTSVDRITGTGHSAVYLSRICTESPVKLRLCLPGEQGSVLSTYISLGEDQAFEWNAVPLSIYLYGVDDSRDRPLFGSLKIKRVLEDRYRSKYLAELCTTASCQTSNSAEWREMVAASLSRGVYMFVAETTEEQDLRFIEEFNSRPNVNHFNGVRRNCADFTRYAINLYFPHAASPDYINDFGMTSPKAIARSFSRYALRHPELHFRVLHFPQVPGTMKRSSEPRKGTEQLYHSKLLLPMVLFAEHILPVMAASYMLTGRFNPEREAQEYPTPQITETRYQLRLARADDDREKALQLESLEREQLDEVDGTRKEWKQYWHTFQLNLSNPSAREMLPRAAALRGVFKQLDKAGTPVVDQNGALWMEVPPANGTSRLGLSASNVLASGSDVHLANEMLEARVNELLTSPKHSRQTMLQFKEDWVLLQGSLAKNTASPSEGLATSASAKSHSAGGN